MTILNEVFRSESFVVDFEDDKRRIKGSMKITPLSDEIAFISMLRGSGVFNNFSVRFLNNIKTVMPDLKEVQFTMEESLIDILNAKTDATLVKVSSTRVSGKIAWVCKIICE